jgi:putative transposase
LIALGHPQLSLVRQCQLVGMARSSFYYQPRGESEFNLHLMRLIDEQYLRTPWYGSRQMKRHLCRQGYAVNRKRIARLMTLMGLLAVVPGPHTSKPHPRHPVYPYLLRGVTIDQPDQVWCADVTYIPMAHGFIYLMAIMDWFSRRVLSWRLSNTQDVEFCLEALQEATERFGAAIIFNTDQGSQFTSEEWTKQLKNHDMRISMDGKGRWMDNIFIERLWRSLKYECVYLNAFETIPDAKQQLGTWIDYYNHERPHSQLKDRTPNEVYLGINPFEVAA